MRPIERISVFAGIALAIIITLSGRGTGGYAFAHNTSQAAGIKIATVDIYAIAERIMSAPDLKQAREDLATSWQAKADALSKELKEMDNDLAVLPQNDPKVQDLLKKAQNKQQDYQKLQQDRQVELERINSAQLIDAFNKIRAAVDSVAGKLEYTHVFSNREFDRQITTVTLSQTLQELLARPVIKGNPADDITKAVMAEMRITP
jgi:Skp family chaperone for outer membrane proteins